MYELKVEIGLGHQVKDFGVNRPALYLYIFVVYSGKAKNELYSNELQKYGPSHTKKFSF
jgi:hypothetical protein